MNGRVNRKLQLIILLVLVSLVGTMSIAYAVLSTTLNINGTLQVQNASWDVHFDNIQVNPYSVEINPVITDNNKVSFSADLTTPGNFYKFTVDIVNEGSIDAMIESVAKTPELTVEQKKYLRYEVEYVDGTSINDSQILKAGETKTISVLFSYRNDIPTSDLPTTEADFDLEIVLVYVQANSTSTEISGEEKLVRVVNGDLNTVGSEICIGEECFYLIENNGESVTMFAKYNLYVGNHCPTSATCSPYGDEATGIQDETMIGATVDASYPRYGTTIFSNISTDYNDSVVKGYVDNYKVYLEQSGVEIEEARLVTKEELVNLGCDISSSNCLQAPYTWIYSHSYWVWSYSTNLADTLWRVNTQGTIGVYSNYSFSTGFGVRPIIKIAIKNIV